MLNTEAYATASKNMKHTILMGDVVKSMATDHTLTYATLRTLVDEVNDTSGEEILSPLTITLGDEFQGVVNDFEAAIRIMYQIDEKSRLVKTPLKIRYSIVYGLISTPINRIRAHEMIGEGLQLARKLISEKKRSRTRFQFDTGHAELDRRLSKIFLVADGISDRWNKKDYHLIHAMIGRSNDQDISDEFQKTRQQIYKRRKTLMIKEYNALKELAVIAAQNLDGCISNA